jgi:hypothetical protein
MKSYKVTILYNNSFQSERSRDTKHINADGIQIQKGTVQFYIEKEDDKFVGLISREIIYVFPIQSTIVELVESPE